eukprot:m.607908 g.607908  ORF g.607908 m.607908 type:complete len:329 (+) comp22482_c0_seq5:327-1313(+)
MNKDRQRKNKRTRQLKHVRGKHALQRPPFPCGDSSRAGKKMRIAAYDNARSINTTAPGDRTVQDRRYWDSMAKRYDKEIYDSFNESVNRKEILGILDKVANREYTCADYGCGIGKYLPALSTRFKWVYGFDLSQALLDKAWEKVVCTGSGRSRQRKLKNVTLTAADLSESIAIQPPLQVDFACCQNVLLEPDENTIRKMLKNVWSTLKPGAKFMLLVPSLESALHVGQMNGDRFRRHMTACAGSDVLLGRLPREGVLTQYYLQTHITRLLLEARFSAPEIVTRLEYKWSHEIGTQTSPDAEALQRVSLPWDWLILCTKPAASPEEADI